jgi:hypothetical protein
VWIVIFREHPKIKSELVGRVFATENVQPPEGAYPVDKFEVKEWDGRPPGLGNPEQGILPDPDPTLDDPDYADKVQQRLDFEALADKAAAEIAWLEATIPLIDTMTLEELRAVLKRVARENMETIRAWRYVIRRLK